MIFIYFPKIISKITFSGENSKKSTVRKAESATCEPAQARPHAHSVQPACIVRDMPTHSAQQGYACAW